jgi:hypothetical protein
LDLEQSLKNKLLVNAVKGFKRAIKFSKNNLVHSHARRLPIMPKADDNDAILL